MRDVPHRGPRGVQLPADMRPPGCLAELLYLDSDVGSARVYAWTLAYQATTGVIAGLRRLGLADPSSEAFGRALWQHGERVSCRRCHCEVLRWHPGTVFCSARCRGLWLDRQAANLMPARMR